MTESLHQFVVQQLGATKFRWRHVSEGSGVPRRTLEKIARGETKNPKIETIERLANYFRGKRAA